MRSDGLKGKGCGVNNQLMSNSWRVIIYVMTKPTHLYLLRLSGHSSSHVGRVRLPEKVY